MFGLIKKILIGLLSSIANVSNYTKCVKQSKMYYSTYKLDRCVGSCNTLNDLSNKVFIPNEREDLNLSVFNMTTGINESKTLTKHISCDCKCKSIQWCNNNKLNIGVSVKKFIYVNNIMSGILLHVIVKVENI